jgi:hypothetical protein
MKIERRRNWQNDGFKIQTVIEEAFKTSWILEEMGRCMSYRKNFNCGIGSIRQYMTEKL